MFSISECLRPCITLALLLLPLTLGQSQQLREGISVQMPQTTSAIAYPAADTADAWIVTVTRDGGLFFGLKPVTPDQLLEEMRITPRNRAAKLYIKADARVPFGSLKQVLHAAHEALFETAVLLTEQPQRTPAHGITPPQGLEVRLGLPSASAIVVQLRNSARPVPTMKVNDQEVPWSDLQNALQQAAHDRRNKVVIVESDESLPYAQLVTVVDAGRALGTTVVISLADFQTS